jgi:hypothetical protein
LRNWTGKIEEAAAAHPDFFIFESLPGAGAVLAPRLLVAMGSQRERYANAAEVQGYSGIAPVTEQSGKKKWVHFRWACPKFCGRAFTSGRDIPSLTRNGREATINNSGSEARDITRQCEGWPSNGFALFFVAGKIGWLMTRADIRLHLPNETHRSLLQQSCEISVDTL